MDPATFATLMQAGTTLLPQITGTSQSGTQNTEMQQLVEMLQNIVASETTTGQQSGQESGTQESNQLTTDRLQNFLSQMMQGTQSVTEETSNIDDEMLRQQQQIFGQMQEMFQGALTSGRFSPEAAREASQNARDAAIRQTMREGAPEVARTVTDSGAYNSTVTDRMQNEVTALAADRGAERDLNTQMAFEGQRQQEMGQIGQMLQQAFSSMLGAQTQTASEGRTTEQTNSEQQQIQEQQMQQFMESLSQFMNQSSQQVDSSQTTDVVQNTEGSSTTTNNSSSPGILGGMFKAIKDNTAVGQIHNAVSG